MKMAKIINLPIVDIIRRCEEAQEHDELPLNHPDIYWKVKFYETLELLIKAQDEVIMYQKMLNIGNVRK